MDVKSRKKRALELMGTKAAPASDPGPKAEGPVLNETGAQPAAGRYMNIIAKRRGMNQLKK